MPSDGNAGQEVRALLLELEPEIQRRFDWPKLLQRLHVRYRGKPNGVLNARCPFEPHRPWLVYFYPKTGRFLCCGCNRKGTITDFLSEAFRGRRPEEIRQFILSNKELVRLGQQTLPF